jgi:hypothetical protein
MKFLNLSGQKFHRLTALARVENKAETHGAQWSFRCDCGTIKTIVGQLVYHGKIKSCGCLRTDRKPRLKHGMAKTKEFNSWASMRQRCKNKDCKAHSDYGGRGITICPEWDDFSKFYADMGPRPKGTSLDRKNNNVGYSPENCHWADQKTQTRNRRTTTFCEFQGETLPLQTWAERFKLPYKTLWHRHKIGKRGAELFGPINLGGDRRSGKKIASNTPRPSLAET